MRPRPRFNVCPATGKYRHPSEQRALAILDSRVFRNGEGNFPRGVYQCEDCGDWHLTSKLASHVRVSHLPP